MPNGWKKNWHQSKLGILRGFDKNRYDSNRRYIGDHFMRDKDTETIEDAAWLYPKYYSMNVTNVARHKKKKMTRKKKNGGGGICINYKSARGGSSGERISCGGNGHRCRSKRTEHHRIKKTKRRISRNECVVLN